MADVGHDVIIMDIDQEKIDHLHRGIMPIYEPGLDRLISKNIDKITFTTKMEEVVREADIHFICVWTPPKDDGSADLSAVKAVAKELGESFARFKIKPPIVVTKSTVPVGTHKIVKRLIQNSYKGEFAVCSNPEFLREGQAIADMMHPDRIVVGSESVDAAREVASSYKDSPVPTILTSIATAEMIKYAANAFLATKISFINEVANVCELVGADVRDVAEGIGTDKRIGKSFLSLEWAMADHVFQKTSGRFSNSRMTRVMISSF